VIAFVEGRSGRGPGEPVAAPAPHHRDRER
jgi:hypothetical protein